MIDTTAIHGISAVGQSPQVSAPSPVATVRPPARSSSSGAHDPSTARQPRRSAERKPDAPREEQPRREEEPRRTAEPRQPDPYQARREQQAEETELRIDQDLETGRIVFQTVRASTGEVIRQVPSEQMVTLARSIREAQGLLIDRQA